MRLSGGNQQKIVVARELDRAPAVLVAHQAAWGLDPGATRFVLEQVIALRDAGAAVVYVSSELEEVLEISDRIAVMAGGQFAGEMPTARGGPQADRSLDGRAAGMMAPVSSLPLTTFKGRAFRLQSARGIGRADPARCTPFVLCAAALVALSGHNPVEAFGAMAVGAVGSPHQIGVALNRTTPYLLAGVGVALCFRAGIINIGAEGQIAVGGIGATAAALAFPLDAPFAVAASLLSAAAAGAVWAGFATAIHLGRRVHEVLTTLLLNFVALLLVQQVLAGPLGQFGAGFLQSPVLPRAAWLWRMPGFGAHSGILIAVVAAAGLSSSLWRTRFGFALRVAGSSRPAARLCRVLAAASLRGASCCWRARWPGSPAAFEVLGVHRRLIEGFSLGFGFKAVTVALLGALEPLAIVPASLFVGLLEAGSLSMQRQVGVPSALVVVIEGLTMLFVLAATVRRA